MHRNDRRELKRAETQHAAKLIRQMNRTICTDARARLLAQIQKIQQRALGHAKALGAL